MNIFDIIKKNNNSNITSENPTFTGGKITIENSNGNKISLINPDDNNIDKEINLSNLRFMNSTAIHNIFGDGSCVATYPLDGDASDLSGNFHGTSTVSSWVTGQFDKAARFDFDYKHINSLATNIKSFSIWVKKDSSITGQANAYIFDFRFNGGDAYFIWNTNGFQYRYITNLKIDTISTTTPPTMNTWHHIYGELTSIHNGVTIGCYSNNPTTNYYFGGDIDQIRFFNRILTNNEVITLYNEEL